MNKNTNNSSTTVYVGLSGGVDSSVSAYLLKEQGYNVVGVHMKNWSQNIGDFECPWKEDYQDAKRLAAFLGIEFKMYDFEADYKDKVVGYMLDEFKIGRTPNPDVMCNQEIKFKLFLDRCLKDGADYIATGHYAIVKNGKLLKAVDSNKDQTYFLYRMTKQALERTMFPLGELPKPKVREIALAAGLPNATRKESMGICFVGQVGIVDFLRQYVETKPGDIVNEDGKVLGQHEGAIFYTVGQRKGLGIGGGLPYYVTGKNMAKNEVYVTTNINDAALWTDTVNVSGLHDISGGLKNGQKLGVRMRHRADILPAVLTLDDKPGYATLAFEGAVKAVTPGQSAVFYDNELCLGGAVVC